MILSGVFVVLLAGVGGYAYSKAQHQVVVTNGPIHRGLNMGMAAMKPYLLQLTLPPNNVHPGDHALAEVTIHANRDVSF
ncbi:MAG: hypothetical protein ACXVPK_07060, partial [Tumebacillaceae bacterium]